MPTHKYQLGCRWWGHLLEHREVARIHDIMPALASTLMGPPVRLLLFSSSCSSAVIPDQASGSGPLRRLLARSHTPSRDRAPQEGGRVPLNVQLVICRSLSADSWLQVGGRVPDERGGGGGRGKNTLMCVRAYQQPREHASSTCATLHVAMPWYGRACNHSTPYGGSARSWHCAVAVLVPCNMSAGCRLSQQGCRHEWLTLWMHVEQATAQIAVADA